MKTYIKTAHPLHLEWELDSQDPDMPLPSIMRVGEKITLPVIREIDTPPVHDLILKNGPRTRINTEITVTIKEITYDYSKRPFVTVIRCGNGGITLQECGNVTYFGLPL